MKKGLKWQQKLISIWRHLAEVLHQRTFGEPFTGISAVQYLLLYIVDFLLQYHVDTKLFEKTRHILCTLWSEKWFSELNSFQTSFLFAQDFLAYKEDVKRSTIWHQRAWSGCFTSQDLRKSDPVRYYYGTILCCKPEIPRSGNVLVEELMPVTKHNFQTGAIRLGAQTKCCSGRTFNFKVVSSKIHCMRSIEDPHFIPGKDDEISDVMHVFISSNVIFAGRYTSRGYYSKYGPVTIPAKRKHQRRHWTA